jgi:hypothetical protein
MKFQIPITKIDAEKRLVYGIAADETVDSSDEIFDYDSSKKYFEDYRSKVEKNTDGKSQGCLRSMHTNIAAGKITQLILDDETKSIPICAKVVDDNEWKKCLEGVYSCLSIGGSYEKRWKDPESGKTRYTANPSEVSLCDLGCNPNTTFEFIKANGITEQREFKHKEEPEKLEIDKSILTEFSKALADKDLAKAFSYEEIKERICGAINSKIHTPFNQGYFWILQTYPDNVIIQGDLDGDGDNDMYSVPYTISDAGEVEIGSDIKQVKTEYVPTVDENGSADEGAELAGKSAEADDLEKKAEGKYGDVAYADETNKKYPIDTEEHVKAAASYFGMPKNRDKYSAEEQKTIDAKIAAAEKKFGIGEAKKAADDESKEDTKDNEMAEKAHDPEFYKMLIEQEVKMYKMVGTVDVEDFDLLIKRRGFTDEEKQDLIKQLADANLEVSVLTKAGAVHSKSTVEKMQKIHHDIADMGGACKCDKCQKIYGINDDFDATNTAKATEIVDLHKSDDGLAKFAERFDSLEKVINGLKTENDALAKKVTELENQPLPGGPILNGSMAMTKNLAGNLPTGTNQLDELGVLKKLRDDEKDPMIKQSISLKVAQMEIKSMQKSTSI